MTQDDPCNRLEATILKLARVLRTDPVACESFHQYSLKAKEQYCKQNEELKKFMGSDPAEQQRIIDDIVKSRK